MGGSRNGKDAKPKAMCLNCRHGNVTGKGVFCTIFPDGDVKIDQPAKYSCNAHEFFSTYS